LGHGCPDCAVVKLANCLGDVGFASAGLSGNDDGPAFWGVGSEAISEETLDGFGKIGDLGVMRGIQPEVFTRPSR